MKLIGIGGGHIDRRGRLTGDYMPAVSNPGTMSEDIGGGAMNALRNAVQHGVQCTLISVRGGDAAGARVGQVAIDAGIADLSATFLDRATPSYTALIDRNGDLIAGFADMGLYDLAFPKQLRRSSIREALAASDAVLCDANVPQAGLERLATISGDKPIFAIGVSPVKVIRLRAILPSLACLFMNHAEAAALTDSKEGKLSRTIERMRGSGLRAAVITAGGDSLTFFDGSDVHTLHPPTPSQVVDVTGAGDALAGVTISALLEGVPLKEAVRRGVAASLMALESAQAVPAFSAAGFAAKLALVPQALPVA